MIRVLQIFLVFILLFFVPPANVNAAPLCFPSLSIDTANNFNTLVTFDTSSASGLSNGTQLRLSTDKTSALTTVQNKTAVFNMGKMIPGEYSFVLFRIFESGSQVAVCSGRNAKFNVPDAGQGGSISNIRGSIEFSPSQPTPTDIIGVTVRDLPKDGRYFVSISQGTNFTHKCIFSNNRQLLTSIGPLKEGSWLVYVAENKDQNESSICQSSGNGVASATITVSIPQQYDSGLFSAPTPTPPPPPCQGGVCKTAFGDIATDPAGFIKRVFGILLSLAGGVALLLIIFSGYRLMASQGNPEKVQEAREQLTSAIVGLLFVIFSIAILTIIGVDILRIPGFGA